MSEIVTSNELAAQIRRDHPNGALFTFAGVPIPPRLLSSNFLAIGATGSGKTTVLMDLARQFGTAGKEVAVIDDLAAINWHEFVASQQRFDEVAYLAELTHAAQLHEIYGEEMANTILCSFGNRVYFRGADVDGQGHDELPTSDLPDHEGYLQLAECSYPVARVSAIDILAASIEARQEGK